jgi:hypothetical protein
MMFEGGGEPISGASGRIPEPIVKGVPDLPTNAYFACGCYKGIPRALDLFGKYCFGFEVSRCPGNRFSACLVPH